MSSLGQLYDSLYAAACGRHPRVRPWHFQWLATCDLHHDLRGLLPALSGDMLDLGCGNKPYQAWLGPAVRSYTGADIGADGQADVSLTPDAPLPFADATFDAVLCTQVLEHVCDLDLLLSELARVTRPGARIIVSMPFLYNLHGAPHDYRRLTEYGIRSLLSRHFDITEMRRQGRIGSTLGQMTLNWVESQLNQRAVTRWLKALLLPLWIPYCALANLSARVLDRLDSTALFYHNSLIVGQRR